MKASAKLTLGYIVKTIVLNMVHWVSFLSIRDKNVWVFGSWDGNSFLDNTKYLYLASQSLPSIKPIWVSNNRALVEALRNRGYRAYCTWQVQAFFYALRAQYYFIDQGPLHSGFFSPTNLWLSGGAKIIQLWHGLPLKRLDSLGLEKARRSRVEEFFSSFAYLNLFNLYINYYVVAPSMLFGRLIAQALQVPEKRILISGYPRNAYQNVTEKLGFSLQAPINRQVRALKAQGRTLIFYIPTFRDYGGNPFKDGALDSEKLKVFLKENKCSLVIKFHAADEVIMDCFMDENIIFLPKDYDLYEILHLCDILVSDYSSIFFDFLTFRKPIVFFTYDYFKYQKFARNFYFDYKQFVPGTIVYTFDEMLKLISEVLAKGADGYEEKRLELDKTCFENKLVLLKNILVDY